MAMKVTETRSENLWDLIQFDAKGLIAAIAIDAQNCEPLMQAWMNTEALRITLQEGRVCYYSRSRQKLWRKGEISGNVQQLESLLIDCDADCLLLKVTQLGAACHTGRKGCFYRDVNLQTGAVTIISQPIQDAKKLYRLT